MSNKPAPIAPKMRECDFDTTHIQVGGRIQFITHRTIKPIQDFSTSVGYVKDEYPSAKFPIDNGTFIALSDGSTLPMSVPSNLTVCSFACGILRVVGPPLNYVHLTFPGSIQGTGLRAAMRVKVEIPPI